MVMNVKLSEVCDSKELRFVKVVIAEPNHQRVAKEYLWEGVFGIFEDEAGNVFNWMFKNISVVELIRNYIVQNDTNIKAKQAWQLKKMEEFFNQFEEAKP